MEYVKNCDLSLLILLQLSAVCLLFSSLLLFLIMRELDALCAVLPCGHSHNFWLRAICIMSMRPLSCAFRREGCRHFFVARDDSIPSSLFWCGLASTLYVFWAEERGEALSFVSVRFQSCLREERILALSLFWTCRSWSIKICSN